MLVTNSIEIGVPSGVRVAVEPVNSKSTPECDQHITEVHAIRFCFRCISNSTLETPSTLEIALRREGMMIAKE